MSSFQGEIRGCLPCSRHIVSVRYTVFYPVSNISQFRTVAKLAESDDTREGAADFDELLLCQLIFTFTKKWNKHGNKFYY